LLTHYKVKTPFYFVDFDILAKRYSYLKQAFSRTAGETLIAYSYKTNYLPSICDFLSRLGSLSEVVSGLEMKIAKRLGIPGSKMIFNGPVKTEAEIREASRLRLMLVNLDSFNELKILERNRINGQKINLGVRLSFAPTDHRDESRFGFSVDDGSALKVCRRVARTRGFKLRALHFHLGSVTTELSRFTEAIEQSIGLMRDIEDYAGTKIEYLDVGGGFALETTPPLLQETHYPTLDAYAQTIGRAIAKSARIHGVEVPILIVEPGRALVGPAVQLVSRIISCKQKRNARYLVVDAGTNLVPSCTYLRHQIRLVGREGLRRMYCVTGPLCMESDVLSPAAALPRVKEGDIIAIEDVGAYSITFSSQFMRPRPAAFGLVDGKLVCLAREEIEEDIIRRMSFRRMKATSAH